MTGLPKESSLSDVPKLTKNFSGEPRNVQKQKKLIILLLMKDDKLLYIYDTNSYQQLN